MPSQGLVFIAQNTFSGVTSSSFDNVFTSTYLHYFMAVDITTSTGAVGLGYRLRASSADVSTTTYYRQYVGGQSTSIASARENPSSWVAAAGFSAPAYLTQAYVHTNIFNPQQSVVTTAIGALGYYGTTGVEVFERSFSQNSTTSFDGITVLVGSGTMSGTCSVFGYVKS